MPTNRPSPLITQAARVALNSAATVAMVTMVALPSTMMTACSPPPPPPAPPPAPPPPPPNADPIQIDPLMQSVKPDQRVQFPQVAAPVDETLARAVIKLCEAIVKGDSSALSGMLDPNGRGILERLIASGEWDDTTQKIQSIRVVNIINLGDPTSQQMSAANVYLAVQEPGRAYVLAWLASRAGDAWIFSGNVATKTTKPRASEFDGLSEDELSKDPAAGATPFAAPQAEQPGSGEAPAPNGTTAPTDAPPSNTPPNPRSPDGIVPPGIRQPGAPS